MYGDGDKDEEAPKTSFTSTSAPAPVASSSAFPPMSRAAPKNPLALVCIVLLWLKAMLVG